MIKDRAIAELLAHFTDKYGSDSFVVRDYWDGDLCAFGIEDVKGRHLLYLNAFRLLPNRFHLHLEDVRMKAQRKTLEQHEAVPLEVVDEYFERYIGNAFKGGTHTV